MTVQIAVAGFLLKESQSLESDPSGYPVGRLLRFFLFFKLRLLTLVVCSFGMSDSVSDSWCRRVLSCERGVEEAFVVLLVIFWMCSRMTVVNRGLRGGSQLDVARVSLRRFPRRWKVHAESSTANSLICWGVSSKGTVVISCSWAFHANNVGQIIFELFAGQHATRRRWMRGHQSYHKKSSLGTGWIDDEERRIEVSVGNFTLC
jgi:hypothetical protein